MRTTRSIFVATMLVGGAFAVPTSAAAAGTWSVMPSASPVGAASTSLVAAACPSVTSCFAVGSGSSTPFVEHWDGAKWSTMSVPGPNTQFSSLTDIACPSTTSCMAVGGAFDRPFFEHWDGAIWTLIPGTAEENGVQLTSIACTSDTNCFAVGITSSSHSHIEHWDGAKWSVSPSPAVDPVSDYLYGVTCASAASCFAVGNVNDDANQRTLIERWNGTGWARVAHPDPGGIYPTLRGVSCVSDTSCFAVGDYRQPQSVGAPLTRTLIERWNGTKWTIVAGPNQSGLFVYANTLTDVTCTSETSCFATRNIQPDGRPWPTAVDHWDGTSWTVSATLSVDPVYNVLSGVACATATNCVAVGFTGDDPQVAMIEHWNGSSWAVSDRRVSPAPPNGALSGVSCAATTCFTVGHYTNTAGIQATLIERRTGSTWTKVAGPNQPGAKKNAFASISCPTATTCFAAGTWVDVQDRVRTLIARWNGRAWSVMHSPDSAATRRSYLVTLAGISCANVTSCFAVGSLYDNGTIKTLVEQWTGKGWLILKSPNRTSLGTNMLEGVSCTSATNCWAVGQSSTDSGARPMTQHWNGTEWALVSSPDVGGAVFDDLHSVSCAGPKMCVAVGALPTRTSTSALIMRWNGTAWSRVTSPDPVGTRGALAGVSCPSATKCFAVGSSLLNTGKRKPLVKAMAGTTWSNGTAAVPAGASDSVLNGVECASTTACFAGGSYDTVGATHTLVERNP